MKSSVALLMALTASPLLATDSAAKRPNIIFVLADDLGYGDLGCYGQNKIQTPCLDRMAAEGMRFTQFYAGSTVCAPSRCVLMTGLHTGHCLVRGNARVPLRPQDVTVARLLKGAGYATGLIGKWGLGEAGSTGVPTRQGFDCFFGYLNQAHAHNYYPAFLWRNEQRVTLRNMVPEGIGGEFRQGWATRKVEYSHDLFASEALRWIEKQKGGPLFLYLALTIAHANNEGMQATGNGQEVPDLGVYKDKDWPEHDRQRGLTASVSCRRCWGRRRSRRRTNTCTGSFTKAASSRRCGWPTGRPCVSAWASGSNCSISRPILVNGPTSPPSIRRSWPALRPS